MLHAVENSADDQQQGNAGNGTRRHLPQLQRALDGVVVVILKL
jgi:hypothetical protein